MQRMFRTPKGTEVPLLNLRGREYLEVKYRIVWFREDHPDWAIETDLLSVTENSAYARATIKDEKGRIIATSHKFETQKGFPDFIEKSETGAIGRALALIGYGTQFCADELDDGKKLEEPRGGAAKKAAAPATAPAANASRPSAPAAAPASKPAASASAAARKSDPGEFMIEFGTRYNGKRLREIPREEIEGYLRWLEKSAKQKGVPLTDEVKGFKSAASAFIASQPSH
jgi:pyruvate/2-oxoglutarate dehydrogenase complex dihydrolipoamide acyltransferase (E2) component